jgi:ectoine hydroxylase-related dioxygenase (phytanoyl-CoA dioxygenase family)
MTEVARYGVNEQTVSPTAIDRTIEQIRLLGYAVVDGGYSAEVIAAFGEAFDRARRRQEELHGGRAALEAIGEHHTIRLPMQYEPLMLDLATNAVILEIARRTIGEYVILNQQNGLINPGSGASSASFASSAASGASGPSAYTQARYHRDLPYQHFVASRPLSLTALFCLDPFTAENGATWIVPASHKEEAFPSDAVVDASSVQAPAPAGSFLVLDAMTFHAGGVNRTNRDRRAVNHVLTMPLIKQQIALPTALGDTFVSADDRALRQLLGYESAVPANVEDFYASRRTKASPHEGHDIGSPGTR